MGRSIDSLEFPRNNDRPRMRDEERGKRENEEKRRGEERRGEERRGEES